MRSSEQVFNKKESGSKHLHFISQQKNGMT